MDERRRSSNAWKYLMVIAIVSVAAAPIVISVRKGNRFDPSKTAVANWMAGATPIPTEIPEPTPDCCRGNGHDWYATDQRVSVHVGGCQGSEGFPLARCRNCGLWRTER